MAETPEAVVPQWQPIASGGGLASNEGFTSEGGLAYFAGKIEKPRLEFHALRIDLAAPELHIVVRGGAVGSNGETLSITVGSFVRENGLAAGINTTPFDKSSTREGEPRTNVGIVVSDGVLISPPNPRFDALVWYSDSGPAIVPQAELSGATDITNAVGGFHQILKAGELTGRSLSSKPRHPRSAVGIDTVPEARFLYLLVIDGSRLGSIGATEAETAIILKALGANEGLNLDGGGSSALVLRFPDGAIYPVNTPIHGGIPGQERAVAACLGVGY